MLVSSSSGSLEFPIIDLLLNGAKARKWMLYFAGDNKFITAISVPKFNALFILKKSQMQAVVSASLVVWLVQGPSKIT
jgi:hypothetical protein